MPLLPVTVGWILDASQGRSQCFVFHRQDEYATQPVEPGGIEDLLGLGGTRTKNHDSWVHATAGASSDCTTARPSLRNISWETLYKYTGRNFEYYKKIGLVPFVGKYWIRRNDELAFHVSDMNTAYGFLREVDNIDRYWLTNQHSFLTTRHVHRSPFLHDPHLISLLIHFWSKINTIDRCWLSYRYVL